MVGETGVVHQRRKRFYQKGVVRVRLSAWGDVVVKALRYYSEGLRIDPRSLGIFPGASDSSLCPGVDSAKAKLKGP